jgi:hypothetical protein
MNSVPSAESIRSLESKGRPLQVEPWMAAHLSRVWQSMKVHVEAGIKKQVSEKKRSNRVAPSATASDQRVVPTASDQRVSATASDTQAPPHTDQ